jgi:DAK2 domain fusion protein YloV
MLTTQEMGERQTAVKAQVLRGEDLKRILAGAVAKLNEDKDAVDALNVFPVPDGDTGTNMYYTLLSANKEAEKIKTSSPTVSEVAEKAAFGALMGARGNSGVILSQLLRGFANGVLHKDVIDAKEFANALNSAADTAYKAVMRPVEGTILTVAKDAAKAAMEKAKSDKTDILDIMKVVLQEGEASLKRTPEKLPVLKEAGVVDAGGKGLMVSIEGGIDAFLKGESVTLNFEEEKEPEPVAVKPVVLEKLEYRYCTEYIIRPSRNHIDFDAIRGDLLAHGDSLMVAGSPELIKVHIHTNNPGVVLEYGLNMGELSQIKIDNMAEQREDFYKEEKDLGVIAVASGQGLVDIFQNLGADAVIEGGQTMNPSAESFVKAIEEVNAKKVFILPNNGNIILTARQVKDLATIGIEVMPTKTVMEGIAALMALDRTLSLEENMDSMGQAISDVKSGEVTYAVRDWESNGLKINQGDYIGLYMGELKAHGTDRDQVLLDLIRDMITDTDEIITVYIGADVTLEEQEELEAILQSEVAEDGLDVEIYRGEQPLYYYLVGIE